MQPFRSLRTSTASTSRGMRRWGSHLRLSESRRHQKLTRLCGGGIQYPRHVLHLISQWSRRLPALYLYRVTWEYPRHPFPGRDRPFSLRTGETRAEPASSRPAVHQPAQLAGPGEPVSCQGGHNARRTTLASLPLGVGIAGAQDTLAVAGRPTAETWQVANAAAGSSAIVAQLAPMAPALVGLEAPGDCEGSWLAVWARGRGPRGACAPPPGPGLCPRLRHPGANGSEGCAGAGPLGGSGQPRAPCPAGCRTARAPRWTPPPSPRGRHADGGAAAARDGARADSSSPPAAHGVVGRAADAPRGRLDAHDPAACCRARHRGGPPQDARRGPRARADPAKSKSRRRKSRMWAPCARGPCWGRCPSEGSGGAQAGRRSPPAIARGGLYVGIVGGEMGAPRCGPSST
jgi:hypothetical protein